MGTHQIVLLLFIGYIIYTIDLKKKYFPVPVVLLLIGIGLSFIPFFEELSISREIIFNVFLPAILFVSAYQFSIEALKKHLGLISVLSTVGMIATVFLLGLTIYLVSQPFVSLSWTGSFLLAAILAPTDPVSVVSILKKSTGKEIIADLVEGESMVNDGTSVVIFSILLSMFQTGNSFSFSRFFMEFFYVSIGGILLGLLLGWLLSKAVHFTHEHRFQVMLSIVIAYGGFYIGEAIGVSGVLVTVLSGIMLSIEVGRTVKETYFKDSLNHFWNIVEPSFVSLIFLLIGIQATEYLVFPYWGLAIVVFVLSLLVRLVVLLGIIFPFSKWRTQFKQAFTGVSLMTWAGIKGTMSVALLLWTERAVSGGDQLIVSLAFATILISLVIQSMGIYPLTKMLSK